MRCTAPSSSSGPTRSMRKPPCRGPADHMSIARPVGLDWPSRLERFDRVGSTNDVVAGWLRDGTPEVCVAIAAEQTAGRGRIGRTWIAPPNAALLCSLGFRPTYLEPAAQWRLAAIVSLAMASPIESAADLSPEAVRLKWP